MNCSIQKSSLAEQDLIDIWLYTLEEWGAVQADKYLDDLDGAIKLIASQPLLCREREEFDPNVQILHHAHHLIVYLLNGDSVYVVRILHESMDIDSHLD